MSNTFIKLPQPRYKERSGFSTTAYFRDNDNAASAPTTIHYRIDDPLTDTNITGWTSISAAASVTVTVLPSENRIVNNSKNTELRQLTVAADKGLSTESRDTLEWRVVNIQGFNE